MHVHTHLSIMYHTQVLTNSFHCDCLRAWIRVQVSPLHTDTKDGLKGKETHHHTVPSKSSKSYSYSRSYFSYSSTLPIPYTATFYSHSSTLPIPYTRYVLLPL